MAYETGDYHHATNWLSESLDQSEIADGHESIDPRLKINILKYLSLTQGKISLQVQVNLKNNPRIINLISYSFKKQQQ